MAARRLRLASALGLVALAIGLVAPGAAGASASPSALGPPAGHAPSSPGARPPPAPKLFQVGVGKQASDPIIDAANGLVYVPNYGSDNVTVINGTVVVGSVPVGAMPRSGGSDGADGLVYVANSGGSNVTVLNGTRAVASVPVGRYPFSAVDDPASGFLDVSDSGSANVTVLNGTRSVASVAVGNTPQYLLFDPANDLVYVDNSGSCNVSALNGSRLAGTLALGTCPPSGAFDPMTVDTENGFLYVTVSGGGFSTLDAVDVFNGTHRIAVLTVGYHAGQPSYDPRTDEVYVPDTGGDNVSLLRNTSVLGSDGPLGCNYYYTSLSAVDSGDGWAYLDLGGDLLCGLSPSGPIYRISLASEPAALAYDARNGCLYVTKEYSGNVTVVGDVGTCVFPIDFAESGLVKGTAWNVTADGARGSASGSQIEFTLENGSYNYTVGAVPGYRTVANGSFAVVGYPVTVLVHFAPVRYAVAVKETGLPAGTFWQLSVGGKTVRGNGSRLVLREPNGSYAFSVSAAGYTATPSGGTVTVAGAKVTVSVTFH